MDDAPFELANPDGGSHALLICDHASNRVPPSVAGGDLGLPPAEMARHIAYDVGARGVTLELARLMDAPAVLGRFSRLVIDPNRGEDDPTLVMRLYDGTVVPANRRIDRAEVARRLDAWHRPFHAAIDTLIETRLGAGVSPALIAIHSFTPKLQAGRPRPWHVGVLWHADDRLSAPLIARLAAEADLCIGDNQPYSGQLEGDTMSRHGLRRNLRHVLVELRHDLIATEEQQRLWAARLAPIFAEIVAATEEDAHG